MSLRTAVLALGIIFLAMPTPHVHAKEEALTLQEAASIMATNLIFKVGGTETGVEDSSLYIAASATTLRGEQGGIGVWVVRLDEEDPSRLFWKPFPQGYRAVFARPYAPCLIRQPDGSLFLIAETDGLQTSAITIPPDGGDANETILFNGNPNITIHNCARTRNGSILVVGAYAGRGFASLLDKDLNEVWSVVYDGREYNQGEAQDDGKRPNYFLEIISDPEEDQFTILGVAGADEGGFAVNSETILVALSLEGVVERSATIPGKLPCFVSRLGNDGDYQIITDRGDMDGTRLFLARVNSEYDVVESTEVFDGPKIYSRPSAMILPDDRVVLGMWSRFTLHLLCYSHTWDRVAAQTFDRPTVGIGSVHLTEISGHAFSVSTKAEEPDEAIGLLRNPIIVERITIP